MWMDVERYEGIPAGAPDFRESRGAIGRARGDRRRSFDFPESKEDTMSQLFPNVPAIPYEGPGSDNPLAFKRYDAKKVVGGKTMAEQLRFSLAFWHSMTGSGSDPFGVGTMLRPWNGVSDPMEVAPHAHARSIRADRKTRHPLHVLPRPRHSPRGRHPEGDQQEARRDRRPGQRSHGDEPDPDSLGHGQSLFQPALHARRLHESRGPRLRLRCGAGQEGPRSNEGTGRRELCLLGADARATRRCSTPR